MSHLMCYTELSRDVIILVCSMLSQNPFANISMYIGLKLQNLHMCQMLLLQVAHYMFVCFIIVLAVLRGITCNKTQEQDISYPPV